MCVLTFSSTHGDGFLGLSIKFQIFINAPAPCANVRNQEDFKYYVT